MEFQWMEDGIYDIFIYKQKNNLVKCTIWGIEESYAITQQSASHHTFITPITLSAVSTGQLMERMAGWIAANCKSFLSLHIPQPLISTQL